MTRILDLNMSSDSDNRTDRKNVVKFLYSYGGKILPRRTDGKLRYVGGFTRVLAVERSITFAELMVKFGELSGTSMNLKCKLPSEDLDVLVSITSDEDLVNIIQEYDRASASAKSEMKVRAILFPIKSLKKISPPPSPVLHSSYSPSKLKPATAAVYDSPPSYAAAYRSHSPAFGYPVALQNDCRKLRYPSLYQQGNRDQLRFVYCHNLSH